MKTFKNNKGTNTGTLIGDTYVSERNEKHFMFKYQGFGLSESFIKELKKLGCVNIRINFNYKGKISCHICSLEKFETSIKTHKNDAGSIVGDNDLQKFVSKRDMVELEVEE